MIPQEYYVEQLRGTYHQTERLAHFIQVFHTNIEVLEIGKCLPFDLRLYSHSSKIMELYSSFKNTLGDY